MLLSCSLRSQAGKAAALLGLAAITLLGVAPRASAQAFAANGGPTVSNALTSLSGYSIEFTFSLNNVNVNTGFQKLIDFNNRTVDSGLYALNDTLTFFPGITSAPVFSAATPVTVLVTRDSASTVFTGYVNNVQRIQFTDDTNLAVFDTNDIRFFQDDAATNFSESGPGTLYSVKVNGRTVIGGAPAAVPEPSGIATIGFLFLGAAGLILKARKRTSLTV